MAESGAAGRTRDRVPQGPPRLDGLLTESAAAHPARTALVGDDRELDYATLDRQVSVLATALTGLLPGAERGTVAVASVLHPDFAVAYYAAVRGGQVVAVVNPLLREEDLLHVLALSGARLAFVDAGLNRRLETVRDRLPALRQVVLIGDPDGADTGLPTLAGLLAGTPAADVTAPPAVAAEDVACIQFTSGTTGRPKAVRLTHRNLAVNAAQIADAHLLDADSVTLNHLPTFHPMHLNSAIRAGATQVLCTGPAPADAVAAANRHSATHLYSLPVRLARLAVDPGLAGLSLRTVTRIASGGSALPGFAAERLTARFGIPVFQGYGLAETSPLTHSDDPDRPVHGSVGRPVAGTECRVLHVDTREVLGADAIGEVQLRGPQLMRGYLGGPDGTGLEADGWFTTGDVGRIDADGRLFLVDRLKDVFKCDNFLVAPSEVEQVLQRHLLVRESVVVDLPDEFSGAVAGALVVLQPGATVADAPAEVRAAVLAEVLETVNEQLPYYQRLRHAVAVGSIPRSGNGKIQRRELREELLYRFDNTSTPGPHERHTMSAPLFTVVNTFTLKDPADGAEFERRFLEHVQWMRAQEGFDSHQAVRRTDQPEVYVNVGWWARPEDFQKVLASEVFQSHAAEFHKVVDVVADPSMGVLRIDAEARPTDAQSSLVVEYFTVTGDAAAFEQAYRSYAGAAARLPGFGHTDLSRSLFLRPDGYTAVTRWADPAARLAAQSGAEYAAVLALAEVSGAAAEPVAGTRTAPTATV